MSELAQAYDQIQRLRAQVQASLQEARTWEDELRKSVELTQERILQGQSTGDPVRDYALTTFGILSESMEQIYRALMDRCQSHIGEPLLLIERREDHNTCVGFGRLPQPSDWYLEVRMSMGTLKSPGLRLDPQTEMEAFTMDAHVVFERYHADLGVVHGDLRPGGFHAPIGAFLDRPIPHLHGRYHPRESLVSVEVKIGNAEVGAWLQEVSLEKAALLTRMQEQLSSIEASTVVPR